MVGPRKIKKIEVTEGSFNGINIPSLSGIKVSLTSKQEVTYAVKTGDVLEKGPANYEIIIDTSELTQAIENKELSEEVQEATKMSFSLYSYRTSTYRYFTTSRNSEQEKEDILKRLIEVLIKYDSKKIDVDNDFEKDFKNNVTFETREIVAFPFKRLDKDVYVVALKDYLENKRDFGRLASLSIAKGYLSAKKNVDVTLGDIGLDSVKKHFPMFNKRGMFFVIDSKLYPALKDFIVEKQLSERYLNESEQKKAEQIDVHSVEITKPNVFDIYIKYVEDKGVFLFKGKGYFQKPVQIGRNMVLERTLWGEIAENHIYQNYTNNDINDDFSITNQNNNRLIPLKGGNYKTGWEIPISELDKLQKIKNAFEVQDKIFGREEVSIVVNKSVDISLAWLNGLAILYHNNDCFLVSKYRVSKKLLPETMNRDDLYIIASPKKHKDGNLTYEDENIVEYSYVNKNTFTGIKIDSQEANMFLETTDYGNVKNHSICLNALLSLNNKEYVNITKEEAEEIFNTKKIHYEMHEDIKVKELKNTSSVKKGFKKF